MASSSHGVKYLTSAERKQAAAIESVEHGAAEYIASIKAERNQKRKKRKTPSSTPGTVMMRGPNHHIRRSPSRKKKKSSRTQKSTLQASSADQGSDCPLTFTAPNETDGSDQVMYGDPLFQLKQVIADCGTSKRTWQQRQERAEAHYDTARPQFFESAVSAFGVLPPSECSKCGEGSPVIRCQDCPSRYMCIDCDATCHKWMPVHRRSHYDAGSWSPVPPCTVQNQTGEFIHTEMFLPPCLRIQCQQCSSYECSPSAMIKVIFVNISGRHEVYLPQYQCRGCGHMYKTTLSNLIQSGYWPGSSRLSQGMYIFDGEMLETYDLLKKEKPGLSAASFLSALELLSARRSRVGSISAKVFISAVREWRRCQFGIQLLAKEDYFSCLACGTTPLSVHVDGNRKVYRYRRPNQVPTTNYYQNVVIDDDEQVDEFVKKVQRSGLKTDSTCGSSHWSAARTRSKTFASLEETGMCIASCRHCIILRAINMHQGEIFAYPLYVAASLAQTMEVKFLCQDIICRFWPWLLKLLQDENVPNTAKQVGNMKPFLSVMHGKAHDWNCQVQWGGRWQDGSAMVSGEEVELCNSYISTAALTTKYMSKGAREEEVTQHFLHWNEKKNKSIAGQLVNRYKKSSQELSMYEEKLQSYNQHDLSPAKLESWKSQLRQFAKDKTQLPYRETDLEDEEILLVLHLTQMNPIQLDDSVSAEEPLFGLLMRLAPKVPTKTSYRDICSRFEDLSAAIQKGKDLLANRCCVLLQEKIEIAFTSLIELQQQLKKLADTSKFRHRLRARIASAKSSLQKHKSDYNQLITLCSLQHGLLTDDAIDEGLWPWHQDDEDIPLKLKKSLVDNHELVKRLKEEKVILGREMLSVLQSLQNRLSAIADQISSVQPDEIPPTESSDRYEVICRTEEFCRGEIGLLRQKHVHVKFQLEVAQSEFRKVIDLESDMDTPADDPVLEKVEDLDEVEDDDLHDVLDLFF